MSFASIASNVLLICGPPGTDRLSATASTMSISAQHVVPDMSMTPVYRIEASLTASVIESLGGAVSRQC